MTRRPAQKTDKIIIENQSITENQITRLCFFLEEVLELTVRIFCGHLTVSLADNPRKSGGKRPKRPQCAIWVKTAKTPYGKVAFDV